MEFENISRRSFIKKTTVLTVGVASITLFSGLVNASMVYNPPLCSLKIIVTERQVLVNGNLRHVKECTCTHPESTAGSRGCGYWPEWSVAQQKMVWEAIRVDCTKSDTVDCM